ncbi:MAG: D-tyrosyl-tRNA(Tyr) deacylase [Candidatus Omnitrophica bacterium]|nr:D-tyrosyl-tRNA(Tyr) deacylase [Candidatus Omnitrophota bacterium]MBU2043938.1 D-tyrosyl-tRNA(Tyr) deacylase [Candidatus Omnitrophota bacterium]MBU2265839.1 D-tyrosyl-tRNA(Tyr) deacylase [Candidatus Omnitrophota bacterium]MBU2474143.1 D-tyrosyl-tRNA(Tyr) deacylase [Candidatus Omnitrophota bacterium]
MKVIVARITNGQIKVAEETVSSIAKGIAVFIGFKKGDKPVDLSSMAEKIVNLRIFEDEAGKLAYSTIDKGYSILAIPNFTLNAVTSRGRRPSFDDSLAYTEAEKFFDAFVLALKAYGLTIEEGVFGAHMDIQLDFDGPVNIILENEK